MVELDPHRIAILDLPSRTSSDGFYLPDSSTPVVFVDPQPWAIDPTDVEDEMQVAVTEARLVNAKVLLGDLHIADMIQDIRDLEVACVPGLSTAAGRQQFQDKIGRVHERDAFMARAIMTADCQRMVAVIGAAHVIGIARRLNDVGIVPEVSQDQEFLKLLALVHDSD